MGEHRPYKPGVTGSNPVPPTNKINNLATGLLSILVGFDQKLTMTFC